MSLDPVPKVMAMETKKWPKPEDTLTEPAWSLGGKRSLCYRHESCMFKKAFWGKSGAWSQITLYPVKGHSGYLAQSNDRN